MPEDLIGEQGLLKQLTKALLERAIDAELTHELANGLSPKRVRSKHGEIDLDIQRDRSAQFEPVLIQQHQRRFDGFDHLILACMRGASLRGIRSHIEELYGIEVSPDLVSAVTDNVQDNAYQKLGQCPEPVHDHVSEQTAAPRRIGKLKKPRISATPG